MQGFIHHDLRIPEISFNSPLTDLVIELDYLRRFKRETSSHTLVFSQLKQIFHMLESIGSARIEGNNTTIAEIIETRLEGNRKVPYNIQEILNLEKAMSFIEALEGKFRIDKDFILHLYRMIMAGLPSEEGVTYVGGYRLKNVVITGVGHIPPDHKLVDDYMKELLTFINSGDSPKYDLIKVAMVHHRFTWIHPFTDGNGRTVRMLSYAMLLRYGFGGREGRIINPTAIFCIDRNTYYRNLASADSGSGNDILRWCEYVLHGLKMEMQKVDRLSDSDFIRREILQPAVTFARERQLITSIEAEILKRAVEQQVIQASDIRDLFPGRDNAIISRQIRKLIEQKMLQPERDGARKYVIRFENSLLLRGLIKSLKDTGFLAKND